MGRDDREHSRQRSYRRSSRSDSRSRSRSESKRRDDRDSRRRDNSSTRGRSNRHHSSHSSYRRRDERSMSNSSSRSESHDRDRKNENKVKEEQFPVANVTETGGEISCSIEETNRIRVSLGLAPLEVDTTEIPTEGTADEEGVIFVDLEKQRHADDIRAKLERSREDREREALQNLDGRSLGDQLMAETGDLDAKAWLEKSRVKQEEAMEAMEEEEEKKEMEPAIVSLAGLKVGHDINELTEGDMVLTLRDAPLMDENGKLVDADDVLESDVLVAQEKQKEINKQRKKAKMPIYSGFDDDEFDSDFDENDRMLPQYAEKKKKDVSFTLTEGGLSSASQETSRALAQQRNVSKSVGLSKVSTEGRASLSSLLLSLNTTTEKQVASEYYSKEEMASFKKKSKRVRRVRHTEKEEEEPVLITDNLSEHSTRRQAHELAVTDGDEEAERKAGYELARAKEEVKNRGLNGHDVTVMQEEVFDDTLQQDMLLRARAAVLAKRRPSAEEIAERISRQRLTAQETGDVATDKQSEFEAVSEFSNRFKSMVGERKREKVSVKEAEEKKVERKEAEAKEAKEAKEANESDSSEEDMYNQPNLNTGLGGVLNYLKSQKGVGLEEEAFGRRNDKVITASEPDDGFVIEHRDKDGRLLTNKEAFRQLSYQFHGKNPGKKNMQRKSQKFMKGLAQKGVH